MVGTHLFIPSVVVRGYLNRPTPIKFIDICHAQDKLGFQQITWLKIITVRCLGIDFISYSELANI